MMYLTFTTHHDALVALNQIDVNMGLPRRDENGYEALTWDSIKKADGQDLWYFSKPQEQYMTGVVNFTDTECQDGWQNDMIQ